MLRKLNVPDRSALCSEVPALVAAYRSTPQSSRLARLDLAELFSGLVRWRKFVALAAILIGGVSFSPVVQAQTTPSVLPENWAGGGAFYDLAAPTAVTVQVHVWGSVGQPGIYQIPRGTKLSTLYSVAGGPTAAPQSPRQRSRSTIRLLRPIGDGYEEIYAQDFRDTPPPFVDDPILMTGDVLSVETRVRERLNWMSVLSTASSVASLVLIIYRLQRI